MSSLAIYIHWPFCKSKCPYCDFNSHVREQIDNKQWESAYLDEIDNFIDVIKDKRISSIFFGGGTPSLMPPIITEKIIDKISSIAKLHNTEITLEANPTSIETDNFKSFKHAGINRVSIGIQSLNEHNLKFLGRTHSITESIKAIELANNLFANYSFDLIYALPNQSLKDWEKELTEALKFTNNHLSLYQLTIEKGTPFYKAHKNKEFTIPDEDLALDLYNLTQDIMNSHNMPAYEVSNHAAVGYESQHNLAYWRYNNYIGIGPGAHSRIDGKSIMMIHNPEQWLNSVNLKKTIQSQENLTIKQQIDECFLMGLRIKEGINLNNISKKFEVNLKDFISYDKIVELQNQGLLILKDDNRLLSELASEEEFRENLAHTAQVYSNAHEDSSTKLTYRLSSHLEFQKGSNLSLTPKGFTLINTILSKIL